MDIALRTEDLSKQYRIGERSSAYRTFREVVTEAALWPIRKTTRLLRDSNPGRVKETIWALKDVSLEVRRGEIVGIIGRNGAGKSTLLKILSRITEPTRGFVEIRGRVGSLLEVGTGFHGELTGRDNVYLNGAILGMRRAEVARKFDEIVAFAEVERFIDTPVKRYSTGMYLRLAFAVAAHFEPDILIIDEVLAVGDARFQKKCLNKMQSVAEQGRTVLFVSHNMPAVARLCERAILLDAGSVIQDGPPARVIGGYLDTGMGTRAAREWSDPAGCPGGGIARLRAVRLRNDSGDVVDASDVRRSVVLEQEYDVLTPGHILSSWFLVTNAEGVHLFSTLELDPVWRRRPRPVGRYVSAASIPGNLLAEGLIFVSVGCARVDPLIVEFFERDAVAFHVVDSHDGDSARGDYTGVMAGVVRPLLSWRTRVVEELVDTGSEAVSEGTIHRPKVVGPPEQEV